MLFSARRTPQAGENRTEGWAGARGNDGARGRETALRLSGTGTGPVRCASLWLAAGVMGLRQSMETRSGTGQGRDAKRPGAKHDSAVPQRGRRPV
ncbi:hypothetical protein [Erwinia mallotivora]|uniref:hypothetical protein n=1 Tax=Erwinia mallotivora TaxID=69222 RepID=UPI0021C06933|nr:hypothetical protein [Erwinia mallotivora]